MGQLDELRDRLRANPDDWRVKLSLAERQVDLGDHADAYRVFRELIDQMDDGLLSTRRFDPIDWMYASRSAAATRRVREAGEWLEATGWNPQQLAAFRDLPEFAPHLDKQPFKDLFGG